MEERREIICGRRVGPVIDGAEVGEKIFSKKFSIINTHKREPTPSNHPHLIFGLTSPMGQSTNSSNTNQQKTTEIMQKKTISLAIVGLSMLPTGGAALLTRPSKENPSQNGVHQLTAGQLARIATRALGFNSPIALKHAISASAGQAVLKIDVEEIKAGEAWENKNTGEKGTYGSKNGGKDWTKYSNHEVELGFGATMKLMEIAATAAIAAQPLSPVSAPAANAPKFGITNDTPSGDNGGGKTEEVEP